MKADILIDRFARKIRDIDFPKNHVFLALIYEGRCQNWNFSLRFSKRLISHRSDLSQVKQSKF